MFLSLNFALSSMRLQVIGHHTIGLHLLELSTQVSDITAGFPKYWLHSVQYSPDQIWQLTGRQARPAGFVSAFWLTGWISQPSSCSPATFYPQSETDCWGILCCLPLMCRHSQAECCGCLSTSFQRRRTLWTGLCAAPQSNSKTPKNESSAL